MCQSFNVSQVIERDVIMMESCITHEGQCHSCTLRGHTGEFIYCDHMSGAQK